MRPIFILIPLIAALIIAPALADDGIPRTSYGNYTELFALVGFNATSNLKLDDLTQNLFIDYTPQPNYYIAIFSLARLGSDGEYGITLYPFGAASQQINLIKTSSVLSYEVDIHANGLWLNKTYSEPYSILPYEELVITPASVLKADGSREWNLEVTNPDRYIMPFTSDPTVHPITEIKVTGPGEFTTKFATIPLAPLAIQPGGPSNDPIKQLISLKDDIFGLLGIAYVLIQWLTIKGAFVMFIVLFELYSMGYRLNDEKDVFAAYSRFFSDNRAVWTFIYQLIFWITSAIWSFVQLINPLKWLI